jgi:hypothetical protein
LKVDTRYRAEPVKRRNKKPLLADVLTSNPKDMDATSNNGLRNNEPSLQRSSGRNKHHRGDFQGKKKSKFKLDGDDILLKLPSFKKQSASSTLSNNTTPTHTPTPSATSVTPVNSQNLTIKSTTPYKTASQTGHTRRPSTLGMQLSTANKAPNPNKSLYPNATAKTRNSTNILGKGTSYHC